MANGKVEKKIPVRRCTGCGEHYPKLQLMRILRTPQGEIIFDAGSKASGRGAYICRNAECLKKARRARRLESSLECAISEEVYLGIEEALSK